MRQGGFTMMEMLVGMSTMMVIGLIAVPSASTYFQRYQLTATAEQLAFEIHRARMQAVGQNRFVRINVTTGQYVREESTNGITYTADDAAVEMPDGVSITVTSGAPGPRFNRNGLAIASTVITIANEDDSKIVRTNLVGRVTVE